MFFSQMNSSGTFTTKNHLDHIKDFNPSNAKYIRTKGIMILRQYYGYKEEIKVDWNPATSAMQDVCFFFHFLKSMKERIKAGHQIYIQWILNEPKKESKAMCKDLEGLVNLKFPYTVHQ